MIAFAIITTITFSSCEALLDIVTEDYIDKAEWGDNHSTIYVYYANLIYPDNFPSDPTVDVKVYKANGKRDTSNSINHQEFYRFKHKYNIVKLQKDVEQGGYVEIFPDSDNDKLSGSFTLKYE